MNVNTKHPSSGTPQINQKEAESSAPSQAKKQAVQPPDAAGPSVQHRSESLETSHGGDVALQQPKKSVKQELKPFPSLPPELHVQILKHTTVGMTAPQIVHLEGHFFGPEGAAPLWEHVARPFLEIMRSQDPSFSMKMSDIVRDGLPASFAKKISVATAQELRGLIAPLGRDTAIYKQLRLIGGYDRIMSLGQIRNIKILELAELDQPPVADEVPMDPNIRLLRHQELMLEISSLDHEISTLTKRFNAQENLSTDSILVRALR